MATPTHPSSGLPEPAHGQTGNQAANRSRETKPLLNGLTRKLFRSRFFTISVLLHFILVLVFGGTALFNNYTPQDDFPMEVSSLPPSYETPERPKSDEVISPPPAFDAKIAEPAIPPASAIPVSPNTMTFIPGPGPFSSAPGTALSSIPKISGPSAPSTEVLSAKQQEARRIFTQWTPPGSKSNSGSSMKDREFEFTAYLAKYGDPKDPVHSGDWAATHTIKDGKIVKGSLPNLLYLMSKMSKDKIHAIPDAVPLDLSSQEIFAKRPPFIFFSGHRDFVLTDKEVENLQNYIRLGGCIWGDSSLPGRNSRFDVAFRREMRRVIPDTNKKWEPLPANHPIYTKNLYYPEIQAPPSGINHYQEPVYALKFDGEVAVIYTANDYGDMWQIALDAKGQYDMSQDEKRNYIAMNKRMLDLSETYYRNINPRTVFDSYKFGTNLVTHLLTRWEDKARQTPRGL